MISGGRYSWQFAGTVRLWEMNGGDEGGKLRHETREAQKGDHDSLLTGSCDLCVGGRWQVTPVTHCCPCPPMPLTIYVQQHLAVSTPRIPSFFHLRYIIAYPVLQPTFYQVLELLLSLVSYGRGICVFR